jgi:alpha-glucosidase (family GH31 glycosyl hydrolase)
MRLLPLAAVSVAVAAFAVASFAVSQPPRSLPQPPRAQPLAEQPPKDGQHIVPESSKPAPSVRAFEIKRPGAPAVRVTFLTPTTVRVRVADAEDKATSVPDYMRVKSDSDYPPVEVAVEENEDHITFRTAAATLEVAPTADLISVSLASADKTLMRAWEIRPGSRTASLALQGDEHIYGFGDKRAALDQRGHKVEMLNRDAFASETNASYKSIPFFLSSGGYGLFFHNFYPATFYVGSTNRGRLDLTASDGAMDFYLFVGEPKSVIAQYTELTGRPAMLPRWAFGYHQAKASYEGRDAFKVAAEMRKRKLPVDVIYYDDWDEQAVEKTFIDSLWQRYHVRLTQGFGMPMFGRFEGSSDEDGELLDSLAAKGFLMVDKKGKAVIGADEHVDADDEKSSVSYLDYFSPSAVKYIFNEKWTDAIENGVILGMVDFGELDHIRNEDKKFWPSLGMSVAKARNLYGLVYPLSVMNGFQHFSGGRATGMVRPGFAGTQRIGWSTTGDSLPTYRNWRAHTRALLNLTLSGFSNVGQDIGGWDSKGPDVLYARWFAAGTFFPFMWSHGQGDHEPYAHGPAVEAAARKFLDLRYRLVPYLYSLHEAAHRTGVPALRSFPLQEPHDAMSYRIDSQFFLGDDLMVAPVFNDKGDRKVYLPPGQWYDFFDETPPVGGGREIERTAVPIDRIPAYVRAGAVIPLGPAMQYTSEKAVDPLSVRAYAFAPQDLSQAPRTNAFSLYEDDGLTNAYQRGEFQRTSLRFEQSSEKVRFEIKSESGNGTYFRTKQRGYRLHFYGMPSRISRVLVDGREIARANEAARARSSDALQVAPTWTVNSAGEVLVSIPPATKRTFTVEFSTAAASACGTDC